MARVPVTRSWEDLGFDAPEPPGRVQPGAGEEWLRRQPKDVQDAILGAGADAWRNGDWPASDWSVRRETPGWRDSYVAAKPPA